MIHPAEAAAIVVVILVVLALAAWAFDPADPPKPRPDYRIPPEEMELIGTDLSEHVAEFFARKARRREIVRDVTGAD